MLITSRLAGVRRCVDRQATEVDHENENLLHREMKNVLIS